MLPSGQVLFLIPIFSLLAQASPPSAFLLQGGTVHTVSGPVIENGSILVRDGKVVGVGRNLTAPEGVTVIDISGKQVYPGMIDAATGLGMAGDAAGAARIDISVNAGSQMDMADEQIPATRANGVTSAIVLRQSGLISGQISLIPLDGSAAILQTAAIHLTFPAIVTVPLTPHEPLDDDDEPKTAVRHPPIPYSQAKKTYDVQMRALLTFFEQARRYSKTKHAKPNARFDAMLPVFAGTLPLFVTAVREREIREAIAFAQKQKIRIVLADASEAYKALDAIKASGFPVILGPTLSLPLSEDDDYDRAFTTPGDLQRAGIKFAIATFSSKSSRNLPYQAGAAVPFGLPKEDAYKAISLNVAEIFGISKRYGSIDEGKVADLIVTDGDPMEATTHVSQVFIAGRPASLETRQKRLSIKYADRPE